MGETQPRGGWCRMGQTQDQNVVDRPEREMGDGLILDLADNSGNIGPRVVTGESQAKDLA